jgi:hypothetical protein
VRQTLPVLVEQEKDGSSKEFVGELFSENKRIAGG